MRTRRANTAQRYDQDTYNFLDSDAEKSATDQATPPPKSTPKKATPRRRKKTADEIDDNFVAEEIPAEDEQDDIAEVSEAASVASVGEVEKPVRRRLKPVRIMEKKNDYLSLEPFPADNYLPRGYMGTFERHVRGSVLVTAWYSGSEGSLQTASEYLNRWFGWTVLPPKETKVQERQCIWRPDVFRKEAAFKEKWLSKLEDDGKRTVLRRMSDSEQWPYHLTTGELPVLMGPDQTEYMFRAGDVHLMSQSGIPFEQDESDDKIPTGWTIDTGGLILDIDWAHVQGVEAPQILALAVVPHADQEYFNYEEEASKPDFQKLGTVQIWEAYGERSEEGFVRPSTTKRASLRNTICLDTGRAKRVVWSPACQHLAILCGNGNVYIVDPGEGCGGYEKLEQGLTCLGLPDEKDIKATCMAWNSFNRLTVGYSDGTVTLWSVYPTAVLARHAVHHSIITSLDTGYPTFPYLVSSSPLGGSTKLYDLRSPCLEVSEAVALGVNTVPHSMSWNDELQGFFAIAPSGNNLNTMVGYMHHSHYPIIRRVFTGERLVTCLNVGKTHPCLLVGGVDGSLYVLNPVFEIVRFRRELTDRLRILSHEHRPKDHFPSTSPAASRGAVRITHGFAMERNRHHPINAKAASTRKKKPKKERDEEKGDESDYAGPADPARGVVYEPLTRITAVKWNPNGQFGHWAAAALGSGLVKIMDLGLEKEANGKPVI